MSEDLFAKAIARALERAGQVDTRIIGHSPVGGGCINRAMVVETASSRFFVKCNSAQRLPMFQAEAKALAAIKASATLRVPAVIGHGVVEGESFLLLEYLPLGPLKVAEQALAGRALAQMHRYVSTQYGWPQDNFIGTSEQRNRWSDDWLSFFLQLRLEPQVAWLAEKGLDLSASLERLQSILPQLFGHYRPQPSLLHGDLWGGNIASCHGQAVVFDPASYYGDRETDIAMSELFGGFSAEFYQAYHTQWPLEPGHARRKPLYQLYHILNHANLFGGNYVRQAGQLIEQAIAAASE